MAEQMTIEGLLSSPNVKEKFVQVYQTAHRKLWVNTVDSKGNPVRICEDAEAFYTQETIAWRKAITENPKILECSYISAYSCFIE